MKASLVALLGAVVSVLAFPPYGPGWLILAGVALFLASLRMAESRRMGLLLGSIYGLVFFGGLMWWLIRLELIALILVPVQAAFLALYGWWLARYSNRSPVLWLGLAIGGWALMELLRYHLPVGGLEWGAAGYALSDNVVTRFPASIIGTSGLTVALVAVAGLLALAVRGHRLLRLWQVALLAGVLLALTVTWALSRSFGDSSNLEVAIVQGSTPCPFEHCPPNERLRTYEQHLELTKTLEPNGAYLVVWSEGSTGSTNADPVLNPEIGAAIGAEAERIGAWFLVGGDRTTSDADWVNANVVFDPDGEIVGEYRKQHPVPFGEYVPLRPIFGIIPATDRVPRDMIRGEGPVVFDIGEFVLGSVISFEGGFSRYALQHRRAGANLIVVATNEGSYGIAPTADQFIGMTRMRAVELGVPLVHAAVTGKSTVIDPLGRFRTTTGLGTQEIYVDSVNPSSGTPFTTIGNSVMWAAALGAVLLWWRNRPLVGSVAESTEKGNPMTQALENLLQEERKFEPTDDFTAQANAKPGVHEEAAADYEAFWMKQALDRITWFTQPQEVLDDTQAPFFKWFKDGELNLSYNCLDRHLEDHGDQVAYHWVGEPGDTRKLTYAELAAEVNRFANGLKSLGVEKGDRVAIYMGMIPELPIAMLACARLGAIHSVVFGGFSSEALASRILDAEAHVVITQDGAWRGGNVVPLKSNTDTALEKTPGVEHTIVVKRTDHGVDMREGRDVWWHELVEGQSEECEPERLNAEDPLYILYTSGTTGKPKGIVHSQGGYLTQVMTTHSYVFDVKPDEDIYWCAADIGWVTGHSYIVYGPLANRTTGVMYEGAPNYPDFDRLWQIIEDHGVTIFYTAPTAIRAFMKWGDEHVEKHDLSSLRVIGTVGEPINPEAWIWYHEKIGGGSCPIVDTWWQTETGAIMITPLPGVVATKPGSATVPFPGVSADVVDEEGQSVPLGGGGFLVITEPWPSMARTIYGDDQRYIDTYWSRFDGRYFPGDGCKRDEEGYFWLLGRVDDIMLVSGHNISTTEVESALVSHPSVAEAAVVGRKDELTGQAIAAFVTLRGGVTGDENLIGELRDHVANTLGPIAKPKSLVFTDDLPKTRSGKIMRRLLQDISENRQLGDVTTLANADIVSEIAEKAKEGSRD